MVHPETIARVNGGTFPGGRSERPSHLLPSPPAISFLLPLRPSLFNGGGDCVSASDPPNPPPGALPFSPASRPLAPGPSSPLSLRHFLPPLTPLVIHSTDSAATNAVGAYGSRAKTVPRCHVGVGGSSDIGRPCGGVSWALPLIGGAVPVSFAATARTLGGIGRNNTTKMGGRIRTNSFICTSGLAWRRRVNLCLWPRGLL